MEDDYGFRYIEGDPHFLSMHVVYYETMILATDLQRIMKHTAKKGYECKNVHHLCDPGVYKITTWQLFRHVLSDKFFTPNIKHKSYVNNRKTQGTIITGTTAQLYMKKIGKMFSSSKTKTKLQLQIPPKLYKTMLKIRKFSKIL